MLRSSLAFKSINLQKESTLVKLCFLGEQTSFSLNNKHKDTHTPQCGPTMWRYLYTFWSTVGKPRFVWAGWDFTWRAYSVGTSGPAALLSKSYGKHGQNTHTHIDKQLHSSNLVLRKWSIAIPLLMMMTKGFEICSMLYWFGLTSLYFVANLCDSNVAKEVGMKKQTQVGGGHLQTQAI